MYKGLGIIPAAGVGARWGNYPKFLLPCGDREWMLDRAIRCMPTDKVAVIYGDETERELYNHVNRCGLMNAVLFARNKNMDLDFWGSMLAGMQYEAEYYYFTMPDTYIPKETFLRFDRQRDFVMGVHYADNPTRYGMIRGKRVVNKEDGEPGLAWGTLGWSKKVRDLWLEADLKTYTDAINLAMEKFEHLFVSMEYYYDMATWNDYVRFVYHIERLYAMDVP